MLSQLHRLQVKLPDGSRIPLRSFCRKALDYQTTHREKFQVEALSVFVQGWISCPADNSDTLIDKRDRKNCYPPNRLQRDFLKPYVRRHSMWLLAKTKR